MNNRELTDRVLGLSDMAHPGPWKWEIKNYKGRKTNKGIPEVLSCPDMSNWSDINEEDCQVYIEDRDGSLISEYRTLAPELARRLQKSEEENQKLQGMIDRLRSAVSEYKTLGGEDYEWLYNFVERVMEDPTPPCTCGTDTPCMDPRPMNEFAIFGRAGYPLLTTEGVRTNVKTHLSFENFGRLFSGRRLRE